MYYFLHPKLRKERLVTKFVAGPKPVRRSCESYQFKILSLSIQLDILKHRIRESFPMNTHVTCDKQYK